MKYLVLGFFLGVIFCFASARAEGPVLSRERVIFHTDRGDIVVAFYPEVAPKHVAQILRLAEAGVFNGVDFYRLEKGFVAQISNYDGRMTRLAPEQEQLVQAIPAEFSKIKHRRGHLSMARRDDPNSGEASFSFMLGEAPHLDGQYTVFGEIVSGMDVLDKIESEDVDNGSRPKYDIMIQRATVVTDGNLAAYKLEGPKHPLDPYLPYQAFLKYFAALAFLVIVGLPFFKSFVAMARKARTTG